MISSCELLSTDRTCSNAVFEEYVGFWSMSVQTVAIFNMSLPAEPWVLHAWLTKVIRSIGHTGGTSHPVGQSCGWSQQESDMFNSEHWSYLFLLLFRSSIIFFFLFHYNSVGSFLKITSSISMIGVELFGIFVSSLVQLW